MGNKSCTWLTTGEICHALSVSRSKLCRWQQRRVLRQGVHWVRKNPNAPQSNQLWNLERCTQTPWGSAAYRFLNFLGVLSPHRGRWLPS